MGPRTAEERSAEMKERTQVSREPANRRKTRQALSEKRGFREEAGNCGAKQVSKKGED
jgi:hypothetical protein